MFTAESPINPHSPETDEYLAFEVDVITAGLPEHLGLAKLARNAAQFQVGKGAAWESTHAAGAVRKPASEETAEAAAYRIAVARAWATPRALALLDLAAGQIVSKTSSGYSRADVVSTMWEVMTAANFAGEKATWSMAGFTTYARLKHGAKLDDLRCGETGDDRGWSRADVVFTSDGATEIADHESGLSAEHDRATAAASFTFISPALTAVVALLAETVTDELTAGALVEAIIERGAACTTQLTAQEAALEAAQSFAVGLELDVEIARITARLVLGNAPRLSLGRAVPQKFDPASVDFYGVLAAELDPAITDPAVQVKNIRNSTAKLRRIGAALPLAA